MPSRIALSGARVRERLSAPAITLLKASSWLLLGAVFSRLASVAAVIVVSRLLLPGDFGKLTLLQTAISLLAGLSCSALVLGVTRKVAETRCSDPSQAGRYLGVTVLLTAMIGVLVSGVFLAAGRALCALVLRDATLGEFAVASASVVAPTALNSAFQSALLGLEAFGANAASQSALGLATAAGLILGAAADGVRGALLATAGAQVIMAAANGVLLRRVASKQGITISYRLHGVEARRLFVLGAPAFAAFVAVAGAGTLGQILLTTSPDGYRRLAAFAIAYRWQLAIVFVPAAVVPGLLPVMSRLRAGEQLQDVRAVFRLTLWATILLSGALAAVVVAGSRPILQLSGRYYAHDALPLVILAVAAVPCAINSVFSSAALSLDAISAWLVSDVALAGVLIGGALWLIGPLGATGLAVAYLAAYVATDAALAPSIRRRLGVALPW